MSLQDWIVPCLVENLESSCGEAHLGESIELHYFFSAPNMVAQLDADLFLMRAAGVLSKCHTFLAHLSRRLTR